MADPSEPKPDQPSETQSQDPFQTTFHQATVGLAHMAPDGRWLRVNDTLCQLVGYTREELQSRTFHDITHPDDLEATIEYMRRALLGELPTFSLEKRYLHKHGAPVWVQVSLSLVRDALGHPKHFNVVVQDISQRKRAEEALRESEERYRLLVEGVEDYAIVMLDPQGRVVSWNRGAERITGYSQNEILGQSVAVFFPPEERWRDEPERELDQARAQGRVEDERWHVRKDGSRFWASGVTTTLRDASGAVRGFAKILRDLTQRRQAQEQQARTQERIEALNAQLQLAMTETHHRVKNNLQLIASLLDMQTIDEPLAVSVKELKRLSLHIRTLAAVHDLLTEAAREGAQKQTVSAQEVLDRLLPLLRQMAGAQRLEFVVEDARLSVRQGTSLALVVSELVSNALKHGHGGVEVTFAVQGQEAVLEVCDDGPGFPEGFDAQAAAHTGLDLVENLTRLDLKGQVRYENRAQGGGRVAVTMRLVES
ncbi:MAG TPA: PAS domain S-box protein [Chthonomonadaceae bacterium]|nr:PAS domain S-box protein [Chthonomonadaceae bacterium]